MAAIYDALGNYVGEDTTGSNGGTTTVVANPPNPPTTNTVPNTTTNTKKVVYQSAAKDSAVSPASDPSQFPAYDDEGNLQPGFKINDETGQTYYSGLGPSTKDTPVSPASDPSQFPAYDDEGNLMPGYAINNETGETYYQGQGPATQQTAGFDPNYDEFGAYDAAVARQVASTSASSVNDPYAGLTPTQLQQLGGADPTDPYIRARLGIPQLPGSTLNVTGGFGFGNLTTNLPSIDNALGTIKSLFSGILGGGTGGGSGLSSLFTNFSATVGGLFGSKPVAGAIAATTGSGVAALVAPVVTDTKLTAVNPASDPSQFPAYDDEGNLQPGFKINDENGQPYYAGLGPGTTNTPVSPASDPSQFPAYDDEGNLQPGFKINDENGQPYYAGLGPSTTNTPVSSASDYGSDYIAPDYNTSELSKQATIVRVTDPNLTPDSKKNLDNIDGANAEIDKANENIQANNQSISANEQLQADALEQQRQAQAIIDQNNAELADDNLPDSRRAELEANNAAQLASIAENAAIIDEAQNNIDDATTNNDTQQASILENETVAQANADAFVANNDGASPTQVSALVDPAAEAAENVFDPDETFNADGESVFDPENVEPNSDPFEQARFEAELAAEVPVEDIVLTPDEQAAADDPFEQRRLELEQEANREQLAMEATDVEPGVFTGQTDEFGGVDEAVAIQQADIDTRNDPALSEEEIQAELDRAVNSDAARDVAPGTDEGLGFAGQTDEFGGVDAAIAAQQASQTEGSQGAAIVAQAKKQATVQARYKQPGNTDWRVRLSLGPGAQYLYNAKPAGILAPLAASGGTDGVIFPYTPNISTTYSANYEQYDLIHSNYRGIFYKSSRVGDITLRGTFTAQNTTEANYLLAVIHFFRSVTKMFYGQDPERGTPPPICLLNGFGGYQFSDHPVVVSSFNYALPNDVDYIRTTNPNNFGLDLNNRYNPAGASLPAGGSLSGLNRLLNAIPNGLPKGALPKTPAPNTVVGSVTNNTPASYVPTKMEIDITLIPVQSRSQVSQQFKLSEFANGNQLKGGFW